MSDYKNIKLDRDLYVGKGFSYNLEQLDPSENYKGTSLEGLDAFERQLKRFDIRISGKNSDTIDKFFSSSQTAVLFPEFIVRTIANGLDNSDTISAISAVRTKIDGLDYRSITSSMEDTSVTTYHISEGGSIPEVNITLSNDLVTLHKYARMFVASYEALRFQKIGVFSIALRQIGDYIAYQQMGNAVDILLGGSDGNDECESFELSSAITYSDLINLWSSFGQYNMTTILVNPSVLPQFLNMTEFRDAAAGLNFHATGKLITPFGAQIIKTKQLPEDVIIALDKNAALETVQSGDITVDTDKLIDRQLERVAVSCMCGFNRITKDAVKSVILSN